jgi:tetratricopeptide (TPR) repeat protein
MSRQVSLCLITLNEEASLPTCLASTAGLFDEVIVVDTGSTDRTKEVAAEFQARVVEFAWVDDFAAARNEGLRHARGDWVFYLDADEFLDDTNRGRLRALLDGLGEENCAYVLQQRSRVAWDKVSRIVLDRVCLFRNRPDHRWQYRVHEQIMPALLSTGARVIRTDIAVDHSGYEDPAVLRRKAERNLPLLQLDHEDRPDDPFTRFNLGWTLLNLGRAADAWPHLVGALEASELIAHLLPWLCVLQARCLRRLGRTEEALAAFEAARARFPGDATLHFEEALLRQECGDLAGAEARLRHLLDGPSGPAPVSDPSRPAPTREGLHGYLARHHLALVLSAQGRPAEAEALWRVVLAEQPAFAPAGVQFGELLLDQGRWLELGPAAAALEAEGGAPVEAAVLRARACLRRGDLAEARRIAEEAAARHPRAVWPRVVLSQALLRLGDEGAAEAVLRDVVRLDPGQAESWRNLAKVLRNQGRLAEAVAVCGEGRQHFPDEPDLLRIQGVTLQELNRPAEAEACLRRYLEVQSGRPDLDAGAGERVAQAHDHLARIYGGQGRFADAEAQWLALLAEAPSWTAAWWELGRLYLAQERWPELERAAQRLEAEPQLAEAASLLRANGHLARNEWTAAEHLARQVLAANPQSAEGRRLLEVVRARTGPGGPAVSPGGAGRPVLD